MKQVWFDLEYLSNGDPLVEEVAEVLGKNDFNVELFGVSMYAEHLPENGFYKIVDNGSRETLYDGMTEEIKIAEWLEQ